MTLVAAYAGLFAWAFAAATVLPLDASFALAGLVAGSKGFWAPVAVATVGNVLGAWTTFRLGSWIGTLRRCPGPREERARRLVGRFGSPALLASPVPVLGDIVVAVAGASGVRLGPFLLWTTLSKAGRYLLVAAAVDVL